jgi:hypothetical protein
MWRFYALIGIVWLCLMPPLFTAGACTAQYAEVSARLSRDAARLGQSPSALAYWREQGVPVSAISPEQCRAAKPRFLARCGIGPLVYAEVPVANLICRIYRDEAVRVQLHYDERDWLIGMRADMKPYKSLPVPFTTRYVDWAR